MAAYYNELDPYAAQWLRNLICAGLIADGEVDERSIVAVRGDDLRGFDQCHLFAGIGVWSHALRLAGWRDDRHVWTGSCPCQPYSAAGKRKGQADARHLWPEWLRLIREREPTVIFGEQVDDAIGADWLDDVFVSLEALDYACGAVDFPACSVGAPQLRQRVYFVADANGGNASAERKQRGGEQRLFEAGDGACALADADSRRRSERSERDGNAPQSRLAASQRDDPCRRGFGELAYSEAIGCGQRSSDDARSAEGARSQRTGSGPADAGSGSMGGTEGVRRNGRPDDQNEGRRQCSSRQASAVNGFWHDAEWIACTDGRTRAVKPGIFPLAPSRPGRVGKLRAAGNCIVSTQAAEFIRAYDER